MATEVTVTVDTDGVSGDYASIAAAVAGELGVSPIAVTSANLVSNDEQLTIICHASTGAEGEWRNVEIVCVADSAPGAGDGQFYYYHNDVLLRSSLSVSWTPSTVTETGFEGLQWYLVKNALNTVDSYIRIREFYYSGKN